MFLVVLLVVETTLTNAATLSFTGQTSATVSTNTAIEFYTGCYAPIDIYLNTSGVNTNSVDTKIVTLGTVVLQTNTATYTGFKAGVFDTYLNFAGYLPIQVGSGKTTTGTAYPTATQYFYVNSYENPGSFINGTNQKVATVYMKPGATVTGVNLDFYRLNGVNTDDSNVSSGINNFTQYIDVLNVVQGTWVYLVNTGYECTFKPTTTDWDVNSSAPAYTSALGTGIAEAAAGKDKTSLAAIGAESIISPSSPYSDNITHKGGQYINTGSYTAEDSWNIWTNKPIIFNFSGNEMIRMVTGVFTDPSIKLWNGVSWGTNDTWSIGKTIMITGNVKKDLSFYNTIGNLGTRYQGNGQTYYTGFMIDVFWYDTTAPSATGIVLENPGYTYVSLSGYAGGYADWTTDDDQFRIIGFSGVNGTNFAFSTTTGYNVLLNSLYVDATNQDFSMIKTGTDFTTYNGFIKFTESWSGNVYVSDIAGNTWVIPLNIVVEPKATFELRVSPAFRDNGPGNGTYTGLATQGDFWLAKLSGSDWIFLHNSVLSGATDAAVTINPNGTGTVTTRIPASGDTYLVAFKGTGMLSIGWTGVWTHQSYSGDGQNVAINFLDFVHVGGAATGVAHTWIFPSLVYNTTGYIKAGDVAATGAGTWDYINGADLALINAGLSIGDPFPSSTQQIYYDFDINSVINAIEQAIILQYDANLGFIDNYGIWGNATSPIAGLYKTGFVNLP